MYKTIVTLFALSTSVLFIVGCGGNLSNNNTNNQVNLTTTAKVQTTTPVAKPAVKPATTPAPKQKTFAEAKAEIQPSKYLTFSNSAFGISFIYPDNWKESVISGATIFKKLAPAGGGAITLTCYDQTKIVGYEEVAPLVNSIEYISNAGEESRKAQILGYQPLSNTIITLNGNKAEKRYYKSTSKNGTAEKVMQMTTVKNGRQCVLTFLALEKTYYDLYEDIIEKSMASLTIK